MEKSFLYILFLIIFQNSFSQNKLSWQGYFSYNEIKDVSEASNTVFAHLKMHCFLKIGLQTLSKPQQLLMGYQDKQYPQYIIVKSLKKL